ncbi:NAD-dependent protein deacetylase [Nocardioides zeae]|uniref:protein acetyllysine N-acetyltransferase n=1 Tax=Nocardioides imazamoxiresistens TaxID=3231893 RepID=A0ABU3PZ21_9ACTN|nr:NAD-dependent protein deacetylase [Nocardioides zeae]MDT9594126.1 NAD-dependent protein deacetylase [Nocardioides zeae]
MTHPAPDPTTDLTTGLTTGAAVDALDSSEAALDLLVGRELVVVGGAGLSTDSGIPDYRGPVAEGLPPRPTPMTFQEFVGAESARRRYWARSHVGWARMRRAEPNAGHRALARLDPALLITQNVDGLHEEAGSRRMVALHGRIADVVCLACRATSSRTSLQQRMEAANPGWTARHAHVEVRPDGDVGLEETDDFVVPPCTACGGVLKPDVVFFGENVPAPRVERCYAAVDALRPRDGALLAVGTSLTVMSGLRFVRRAAKAGVPVVVVNRGTTRGDALAAYVVTTGCSEFLEALVRRSERLRGV